MQKKIQPLGREVFKSLPGSLRGHLLGRLLLGLRPHGVPELTPNLHRPLLPTPGGRDTQSAGPTDQGA